MYGPHATEPDPSRPGAAMGDARDLGVRQMTASVLVSDRDTARCPGRGAPARPHGRYDCGCGHPGCHDEFAALAATTDPCGRTARRDRLIEAHLHLAYAIAGHYDRPGPGLDDIRQVAALALVEAVNRFDPGLGTAFSAFAVPTIAGAIKRYFRDQRWTLHPPRRIKELRLQIRDAGDVLTQRLHRYPGVADLARYLGRSEAEIREALCTDDALRPLSIDAPVPATDDGTSLAATLGGPDAGYTRVENAQALRPLLAELPERERRVITLRFVENLTQSQIAEQIGCSQMHISRILRSALDRLRRGLQDGTLRAPDGLAHDADSRPVPAAPTQNADGVHAGRRPDGSGTAAPDPVRSAAPDPVRSAGPDVAGDTGPVPASGRRDTGPPTGRTGHCRRMRLRRRMRVTLPARPPPVGSRPGRRRRVDGRTVSRWSYRRRARRPRSPPACSGPARPHLVSITMTT